MMKEGRDLERTTNQYKGENVLCENSRKQSDEINQGPIDPDETPFATECLHYTAM